MVLMDFGVVKPGTPTLCIFDSQIGVSGDHAAVQGWGTLPQVRGQVSDSG
jgi:hypothetical protein